MDTPLNLIIGSHNHVPRGAGDDEFEHIYTGKLKPFIVALNTYPKIQAVLHYSGVLLHWIEKAHPECFMLLGDLVSRKQVELLGGGFHEPMMPLISQPDKIGQIEMLTTYIRKQFGKRPQGCWLPALAWDQTMIGALNTCGMGYTFLREEQFIQAGLSGEDRYAPCITEEQGKLITVFPLASAILEDFKRDSPFGALEKQSQELPAGSERTISIFPDRLFSSGGDAPAAEGAINQFFEDLSRCEAFASFTTPSKILKTRRFLKKAYFRASAEDEAGGDGSPAICEGQPRRFLITYPEANGIYSKMMFTHLLINQLRGDKSRKRTAQEELWKAQGRDAFCRTESGGIYRHTIRNAAYRALLEAEKTTRKKGVFIPSLMTLDFDLDGEDEYLFQDDHINCYVTGRGASVFEFDFLPRTWNYLDTLAPRGETGPTAAAKRRTSFADMLSPPDIPLEALAGLSGVPSGVRFCGGETWEVQDLDKAHEKAVFALAAKTACPFAAIGILKTYHLKKDALRVRYTLTNRGDTPALFNFIPRLDLSFPGEGEQFQRVFKITGAGKEPLGEGETAPDAEGIEFQDLKNEVIITLSSDRGFDARLLQVTAPCLVYGSEQRLYQSTCVLPARKINLDAEGSFTAEYTLKLAY
ncbi:glycosyl hydrolase [Spirochaetia bacterium]|nr:glycosyl hydrolase [Spirochaetia bacterium]